MRFKGAPSDGTHLLAIRHRRRVPTELLPSRGSSVHGLDVPFPYPPAPADMQGAPSPQSAAQQQQQQQQDALADDFLEGHPRYTQVRLASSLAVRQSLECTSTAQLSDTSLHVEA